jgi:hypothetical protein
MNSNEQGALHHYPRRFRWRSWPTSAGLYVNGRRVGAVQAIQWGEWEAYVYGSFEPSSIHTRRCDAKRAVERAAVRGGR